MKIISLFGTLRPIVLAATLTLALTLAACGDGGSDVSPGSNTDDAAAPDAGLVSGTVTGDLIVVDRGTMAELPCHAMDNTIMGSCSDEDVATVLDAMGVDKSQIILHDLQLMADQTCHTMENTIMGQCSEADVTRFADEIRASR